jgi:hypothetical protein
MTYNYGDYLIYIYRKIKQKHVLKRIELKGLEGGKLKRKCVEKLKNYFNV